MLSLDETNIRASFVNASRKEVTDLSLPDGFPDLDWERLDYLGWRDRRIARRAYLVIPTGEPDGAVVGVVLRQAEAAPRSRAQCLWCQDVRLPNDVVFYSAKRAGEAGRKGDTVGTLVCAEFQCSDNVRKALPMAYLGFDVDAAREERIATLRTRAAGFAAVVLHGS